MSTETRTITSEEVTLMVTAQGNPVVSKCLKADGTVDAYVLAAKIGQGCIESIASAKKRARASKNKKEVLPLHEWMFCPICGWPAMDSLIGHYTEKHNNIPGVEQELGLEPGDLPTSAVRSARLGETFRTSGGMGETKKKELHELLESKTWDPKKDTKQARRLAIHNPELLQKHGYDVVAILKTK